MRLLSLPPTRGLPSDSSQTNRACTRAASRSPYIGRMKLKMKSKLKLGKGKGSSSATAVASRSLSAGKAAAKNSSANNDSRSGKAPRSSSGITKKKKSRLLADSRRNTLLPQLQNEVDARASAATARRQEKKMAATGLKAASALDGMKASLEELMEHNETSHKEAWQSRKRSLSAKARSRIVVQETAHLQKVLEHPAFKANPIAALNEHIKNIVDASNAGEKWWGDKPQQQARSGTIKKRSRDS